MGKTTTVKADKLQEVIMAKTMNSIAGVPTETKKASKKTETKKATKEEKAPKVEKAKKEKKEKKESAPREVKYNYPAECTGSLEKKKFRAEFRAKVHRFESELEKLGEGTKEYKKVAKELKEYRAQYLRG